MNSKFRYKLLIPFMLIVIFVFVVSMCQQSVSIQSLNRISKIPIDGKRWYQLSNVSNGLDKLFDSIENEVIFSGSNGVIKYYDAYYPVLDGEKISIDSIRFLAGAGVSEVPMKIFTIDSKWNRTLIAQFNGSNIRKWVGPNPERPTVFKLDSRARDIKYLMITVGDIFPIEIEFYGEYASSIKSTAPKLNHPPLKSFFGVNAFEWNFEDNKLPSKIDSLLLKGIKNFCGVRHYLDWQRLEKDKGKYTFNPTHNGGWNYDAIYEVCKKNRIDVLVCLKTIPSWIESTYPEKDRDVENNPLPYKMNASLPNSYIDQARVAFQFVARYGSNKNIDPILLSVNKTPRWNGDEINEAKVGMDLINYIECDNERDKWWKGRKAYQTAREYAANLSAFYDGHLNTLGPGVGVKNADINVKVVMGGVALPTPDYLRGMIDWCKEFRGYNPDGSVNLCWDIVNYHLYINDQILNRGVSPEKEMLNNNAIEIAKSFIETSHLYAKDMPVWITEAGYDINSGSPNKAIPIKGKSALETQADWILRTALMYSRNGIQKLFFYQLYDDNSNSNVIYGTSGLLNRDISRRPAADFIFQTQTNFGDYRFVRSLSKYPVVDEYVNPSLTSMYVLYFPDETGRTGEYRLELIEEDSVYIHTPKINSDKMNIIIKKLNGGIITLPVSETPIFVIGKNKLRSSFVK